MVTKAERTGQVAASALMTRDGEEAAPPAVVEAPVPDPTIELAQLRARISEARMLEPTPAETHCRDCFHRGRNAVLRLLDTL